MSVMTGDIALSPGVGRQCTAAELAKQGCKLVKNKSINSNYAQALPSIREY